MSGLRPGALLKACPRLVKRLIKLLEIPAPEAPQWIRRITIMERNLMLPIKAAAIAMIFSFYFTRWILVAPPAPSGRRDARCARSRQ